MLQAAVATLQSISLQKASIGFVNHMYDANLLKLGMSIIKGMINEFIPLHTVILFGLRTSHNNNFLRQIY